MEGEDRLILQPLVIPDPGFTVIVRAPQPRWVIGASVEPSRVGGIGGNRQGEGIGRQALTEWLPVGRVTNSSYGGRLTTHQKAQGDE
jgi:hypothetical protein